jgi:hypothetical protein
MIIGSGPFLELGPGGGSRHGTGRDATGAVGTAPVIIGRYAYLSLRVFLYYSWADGYAIAYTGAYGSRAGSTSRRGTKTNRLRE